MSEEDSSVFSLQFDGDETSRPFIHRDGKGVATYANGDIYTGNFVNQTKHDAHATYQFNSLGENVAYSGSYQNGKRHGQGTMTYPDQSTYNGEWADGNRHGHGVYVYPNGDQYIGSWRDDRRDGEGRYLFAKDRTEFSGVWTAGECANGQWEVYAGKPYVAQIKDGRVVGYV